MGSNNGFDELEFLKPEEVAQLFKVSKATVYRWAERGILPSFRQGKIVRFNAGEVKAALKRGLDKKAR